MKPTDGVLLRRNVIHEDEVALEVGTSSADTEADEYDSKEIRLTLMEEIVLLGLKDKEGYISFFNDSVSGGLRGCILIELALRGRIALEPAGMRRRNLFSRAVIVTNGLPTGDSLLDEALKLIKSNSPQNVKSWIDYLNGDTWNPFKIGLQLRNVRERIAKNLVEKGVCTTEKQNILVFDMVTHPVTDFHTKKRLVTRVQDGLLNRWNVNISRIDKRLLVLVLLAHHSNVLDTVLETLSDVDYDLAKGRVADALKLEFSTDSPKDESNDVIWAVLTTFDM